MSNKKVKPHYLGHRARLLKRVLQHISYVEEYELLEILLTCAHTRKDLKSQAKSILQEAGSIRTMVKYPSSYEHIEGIGSSLSWYCSFLTEVAQRYAIIDHSESPHTHDDTSALEPSSDTPYVISSFGQVKEYLENNDIYTCTEQDYIIYVNSKKEIISMEECSFLEESLEFITHVIQIKPTAIILVRKIAEEMYSLRKEDIEILKKREKALSMFGIALLDYIICTPYNMISLQQYSILER